MQNLQSSSGCRASDSFDHEFSVPIHNQKVGRCEQHSCTELTVERPLNHE